MLQPQQETTTVEISQREMPLQVTPGLSYSQVVQNQNRREIKHENVGNQIPPHSTATLTRLEQLETNQASR